MPEIYAALIRHGDYDQKPGAPSAHQPYPLTPKGLEQAKNAADRINTLATELGASVHPQIFSSNLLRGWQTAEAIRDALQLDQSAQGLDDLAERGLGSAANLTVNEIAKIMAADPRYEVPPLDWKSNSHYRLPLQGAESLMEAGTRVASCMEATVLKVATALDQDRIVLFVGHGAAFRHAAYHLGVLTFGEIARLSMYHAEPVVLKAAIDGPWSHEAGEWKVRRLAEEPMD